MSQWFGLSLAFFSLSEALLLNMPKEKKLYIIRHGTTEMNEALGRQPWGSKSFKDQLLWDTGRQLLFSLLRSILLDR